MDNQCTEGYEDPLHEKEIFIPFASEVKEDGCNFTEEEDPLEIKVKDEITEDVNFFNTEKPEYISDVFLDKHKCSFCSETFSFSEDLKHHMLSHENVQRFNCTECSEVFLYASDLSFHLQLHQKLKSFECSECDEIIIPSNFPHSLSYSKLVYEHMLSHSDKKQKNNLFRNKVTKFKKQKLKTFKCSLCDGVYFSSDNLNSSLYNDLVYRHMCSHSAKKQPACTEFKKKFYFFKNNQSTDKK